MRNPYKKVTKKSILQKVNRKRNPATSLVQLAEEYGIPTAFYRSNGAVGHSSPRRFRSLVASEVGTRTYNQIRDNTKVRTV